MRKLKFKKGDHLQHKENSNNKRIITGVQHKDFHEYRMDGSSYWWSANAIEEAFELDVIVDSPLWKALQ